MTFGQRPVDAKIYRIKWEEIERKRTPAALFTTEEGTLEGRPVIRKTMTPRFRSGSLSPREREWFIFDGAFWPSKSQLSRYLANLAEERKKNEINTKYR